jgi:hypothetical protein
MGGGGSGPPAPPARKSDYIIRSILLDKKGIPMTAAEQYVVDENGKKVAVILPIGEYEHLKEDLHDLAMVAERRDEDIISLAELKKRVM